MPRSCTLAATVLLATAAPHAGASDGFVDLGHGVGAKGMGGAGIAYAQGALAPATNPAGIAFIADRIDIGLTRCMADRSATLGDAGSDGDGQSWIPEAGLRQAIDARYSFGLALFGGSGMHTRYDRAFFGTTDTGFDLSQIFLAPTLAVQVAEGHALGVSLLLAYQRVEATGLQYLGVDDPGYDSSVGAGFRIGYAGAATSWLDIGATFQSRTRMSRFDMYDRFFAQQGDLDIPASYAVGFALTPADGTTMALDVERILYSTVAALGNGMDASNMMRFGADDGPGFGWRDITVFKLGIDQVVTPGLRLRAGYNHCSQPIPENQTYLNILTPGVVQDHVTAGATLRISPTIEITAFYAHAFENTVKGAGNVMGQDADLTMSQDMVGVGIGWTR